MFSQDLYGELTEHEKAPLAFSHVLAQARRGETEGVSTLYRQFLPGVFGYIAARIADRATAEDLTSEVFLQMVKGISRVRAQDEPQFAAWLFHIARMTVAGYYRQAKRQPVQVSLEPIVTHEAARESAEILAAFADTDPANRAEWGEAWERVVAAINLLTEEQRLVLVGRLVLGYDVADVAKIIGKKSNAVKALQFRALKSLQRFLQKENESASSEKDRRRRA